MMLQTWFSGDRRDVILRNVSWVESSVWALRWVSGRYDGIFAGSIFCLDIYFLFSFFIFVIKALVGVFLSLPRPLYLPPPPTDRPRMCAPECEVNDQITIRHATRAYAPPSPPPPPPPPTSDVGPECVVTDKYGMQPGNTPPPLFLSFSVCLSAIVFLYVPLAGCSVFFRPSPWRCRRPPTPRCA